MARRYSRRRDDGVVEYSESLEELEASAAHEDEQALRRTSALIGFLLGAAATYGLLKLYAADLPKVIRFITLLAGACSSSLIFARLAVVLRVMWSIAVTAGVLGGIGYLIWKVL